MNGIEDSDRYRLEVIAQEPSTGQACVRLPEGADVHPAEQDHAIDVIMRELGAESREAEPETVIGLATFHGGTFVEFERTDPTEDRPTSLAEYATDGGTSDREQAPKPSLYSSPNDIRCDRCGIEATKGYEGREFLDFCDGCFRMFERWLEGEDEENGRSIDTGSEQEARR